jgi:hypothetical protein
MRKITICTLHKTVKLPTHSYQIYRMQPGTAWKLDAYGKHEVVEVDEALCKKADHEDGCTMHFDGRGMMIFKVGEQEYLQPTEENDKATDDRLGKKRKIRKLRKPRREAPGVAPEAEGSYMLTVAPDSDQVRKERKPRRGTALPPGEFKPYRRAGPRRGLTLA